MRGVTVPKDILARGFEGSFSAILDGQLTTLVAALILFWLGTGPVRGFGVTLGLGLASPMFAAIEAVAKARQFSAEGLMAAVGNNTAREIMEMVQIPAEAITEIDKALHQMINDLEG